MLTYIYQCPKLRVYPEPGAYIFTAGCTFFEGVHPVCARFFEPVIIAIYRGCNGEIPGHTVLGEVHPVGAPNKTLILDTDLYMPTQDAIRKHRKICGPIVRCFKR